MCRHLAWLGRPRTLAELLLAGPHSLLEQSYRPRQQRHGTVNADGFGAGWYAPVRPEPVRYRRDRPIWTDASFASLAGTVASGCVLAAVRSATVGMPVDESATAPFTSGRLLFSHNGVLDGAAVRALLPPGTAVESAVDSALLWALLLARLRDGLPLAAAVADVVVAAAAAGPGRFNLLVTDGEQVVASRWGDTLFVHEDPDGVLVGSEPGAAGVPDGGWHPVPDRSLVVAGPAGLRVDPLDGEPSSDRTPALVEGNHP
jgi:gamma-glutamyl hercynylcysteine S-oxide hydrolase